MKKYIVLVFMFCLNLTTAQTTAGTYIIKNLDINTEYSDFGAAFYGNDRVIFSSPRGKKSLIKNVWKPNSQPYLDLYIGSINNDEQIIEKQKVAGNINSKFHEANVVFTKDLKTVYFTGNNFYNNIENNDSSGVLRLQLYKASVLKDGSWGNVIKLSFNSDEYSTGHPALSDDERKLYFVSDRPESIGKTDIYVVVINDNGTFTEPKNLGPHINTKEKEVFPFISANDVLYFSSSGYQNNGGLDIFASKITSTGFSKPLNLGTTINSKKDDFAFIIKDHAGYFSSNRKSGKGDDDIYGFKVIEPLIIECEQIITGVIKNMSANLPVEQVEISILDTKNTVLKQIVSNHEGVFSFKMSCNSSYKILAVKEGFENDSKIVTTADDFDSRTINISLNLNPIIEEVTEKNILNIESIYFDLNSWNIRADAARELDKVVDFMKKNPMAIVESRSHTDARGRDESNLNLSDKRAKSTVAYIISQGIEKSRISGKGFGETKLLNRCSNFVKCSSDEHQINRRTEFVIVNKKHQK
jgi:outer membrane protein OmpA-like peptidoglycan-associated protein